MKTVPIEVLKQAFSYCPVTGIIIWKNPNPKAYCCKKGSIAGSIWENKRKIYRVICIDGNLLKAHRIAWAMYYGYWPINQIDHKDQNGLNNKIDNLRDVEQTINQKNRRRNLNNKSGMAGIHYDKKLKKWRASVQSNGKKLMLGDFKKIEYAITIRKKANIHFGFYNV